MKMKNSQHRLKKWICLLVVFIAYPILQANIYSSENQTRNVNVIKSDYVSLFGEYNRDLLTNPFTHIFQYEFAVVEERIPAKKVYSIGFLNELRLATFLNSHNPTIKFSEAKLLATNYIKYCKIEGINHDIAFAQMCLETGFLKFGGSVLLHQNNFCGLGAINSNCAGESYKTQEIGIIAHVQHLKAYACKDDLKSKLVDNRFKYVERGSAETISDLTGKWAADSNYGEKIEKLLLKMYSI